MQFKYQDFKNSLLSIKLQLKFIKYRIFLPCAQLLRLMLEPMQMPLIRR